MTRIECGHERGGGGGFQPCPRPPGHEGIHVYWRATRRPDGDWRLLAVNEAGATVADLFVADQPNAARTRAAIALREHAERSAG